jgi:hypothetical protein
VRGTHKFPRAPSLGPPPFVVAGPIVVVIFLVAVLVYFFVGVIGLHFEDEVWGKSEACVPQDRETFVH